jgi:hypothetical protein
MSYHIETFGPEVLDETSSRLEVFVAATGVEETECSPAPTGRLGGIGKEMTGPRTSSGWKDELPS